MKATLIGPCEVGAGCVLDPTVIIGYPAKASLAAHSRLDSSSGATVGPECILRSGTVIYEGVTLGSRSQTAHHVVIREHVRIGERCVFGSGTTVREYATLGANVRLMEGVVVSEGAQVGDDVFVGPNVTFTAGRHMTGAWQAAGKLTGEQAAAIEGRYWDGPSVIVEDCVRIGANAVLLAGVTLGRRCVIAAGAVVSMNVPADATVAGNPGRILRVDPPV